MLYPELDDLLKKVDSKYTLTMMAAKRARQINEYFSAVKRQELATTKPPQVESLHNKPLSIALEEILQDKVTYERLADGIK